MSRRQEYGKILARALRACGFPKPKTNHRLRDVSFPVSWPYWRIGVIFEDESLTSERIAVANEWRVVRLAYSEVRHHIDLAVQLVYACRRPSILRDPHYWIEVFEIAAMMRIGNTVLLDRAGLSNSKDAEAVFTDESWDALHPLIGDWSRIYGCSRPNAFRSNPHRVYLKLSLLEAKLAQYEFENFRDRDPQTRKMWTNAELARLGVEHVFARSLTPSHVTPVVHNAKQVVTLSGSKSRRDEFRIVTSALRKEAKNNDIDWPSLANNIWITGCRVALEGFSSRPHIDEDLEPDQPKTKLIALAPHTGRRRRKRKHVHRLHARARPARSAWE